MPELYVAFAMYLIVHEHSERPYPIITDHSEQVLMLVSTSADKKWSTQQALYLL